MAWTETRGPGRPSDFRTPALVLLAVAAVLEGYASLGTIGASAVVVGPLGATLFALGCLALATALTRPAGSERHSSAEVSLLGASVVLVAITLATVVGVPGFGADTVGASDLLVAVAALFAAGSGERRSHRRIHAAVHPSRIPPGVVTSASSTRTAAIAGNHFRRHFH